MWWVAAAAGGAVIVYVGGGIGDALNSLWIRPRIERMLPHLCPACGYDLTGNQSGVCPECGRAVEAVGKPVQSPP